jgi:urea transport system substrate-binding protein
VRRLYSTLAISAMLALMASAAQAQTKIGAIFDLTGGLNIYGIQRNNALKFAVEAINAKGGVLGQPVEVVFYDAQSEQSKYTQYANTVVLRDRVSALFAGLTSSSREAIGRSSARQTFRISMGRSTKAARATSRHS